MEKTKLTKIDKFAILRKIVNTNTAIVPEVKKFALDFIDAEVTLLEKRKGNGKATKTQVANVDIKADVMSILASQPMLRATEIAEVLNVSVQKASAMLSQLVKSGEVKRVADGKVTRFELS